MNCLLCTHPIQGTRAVGDDRWRDADGKIVAVAAGKGYAHVACNLEMQKLQPMFKRGADPMTSRGARHAENCNFELFHNQECDCGLGELVEALECAIADLEEGRSCASTRREVDNGAICPISSTT